jgi:hypothetical protein
MKAMKQQNSKKTYKILIKLSNIKIKLGNIKLNQVTVNWGLNNLHTNSISLHSNLSSFQFRSDSQITVDIPLFWIAICKVKFSTSLSWLLNLPILRILYIRDSGSLLRQRSASPEDDQRRGPGRCSTI